MPKSPLTMNSSTTASTLILSSLLNKQQSNFPTQFQWPNEDLAYAAQVDQLQDPPLDLTGFLSGDEEATRRAAAQMRTACLKYGFFQVVNHGVDASLIRAVEQHMDAFFDLPLGEKLAVRRKPGDLCGYSGAHADRFLSKLPWKETFSFTYDFTNGDVVSHIRSLLGQDFEEAGIIYQKYCEAMEKLSMAIFELLAISLGVDQSHFLKFFSDGSSIVRGNNYPPCKEAGLTLGTGPHCDPNSLTILHQDQVGGLEIFFDGKWRAISPCPGAFVVNIGDTFMALSNGKYKSCLHRAVVHKERTRRSIVFFVNPEEDKIVTPPKEEPRVYPDFTWSILRDFTQKHYRPDGDTFQNFLHWHQTHHHLP